MPRQAPRQVKPDLKGTIAANLKAARRAKKLSHRQLAQALELDQASISRWERGKITPALTNLVRLAGALDQDVSWFYVDHGHERPEIKEAA